MTMLPFFNHAYEFHYWANERILRTAANLSEAQLVTRVFPNHNGLCGTLVHTMSAEWLWLQRWRGTSPKSSWREEDFPTLESIRERWHQQEQDMREFLAAQHDEDLHHVIHYTRLNGTALAFPLWQLMAHVVNHGTQHRAEAAAMLTELGHSPGDMDMVLYLQEKTPPLQ